jgi:hypothetical protein
MTMHYYMISWPDENEPFIAAKEELIWIKSNACGIFVHGSQFDSDFSVSFVKIEGNFQGSRLEKSSHQKAYSLGYHRIQQGLGWARLHCSFSFGRWTSLQ